VNERLVVISDAHLFPGDRPHPGRERLISFLDGLASSGPATLVVAGDLFDFWFEYRNAVPAGFCRVLASLEALSGKGWEVVFMPGNHDWWVGRRFEEATGARIARERQLVLERGGLRIVIAHGDGLGRGDPGYRLLLRPVVRSRVSTALFSLLHPDLGAMLAGAASGTSRRILRKQAEQMPAGLLDWVRGRIAEGAGLVITGHTHIASETPMPGGAHISLGDWLKTFTYAEVSGGAAALRHCPEPVRDAACRPSLTP